MVSREIMEMPTKRFIRELKAELIALPKGWDRDQLVDNGLDTLLRGLRRFETVPLHYWEEIMNQLRPLEKLLSPKAKIFYQAIAERIRDQKDYYYRKIDQADSKKPPRKSKPNDSWLIN